MASTVLTQTISLLYRMQSADIDDLANRIFQQRRQAYRTELLNMTRRHGCNSLNIPEPRGAELQELQQMSRNDARSIANTWNQDVTRHVERLFDQNRRGNRQYYFSNLERWASDRDAWKSPSVALNTETTTRQFVQIQFRFNNNLRGGRYRFSGPPPICPICISLFAMGVVDEDTMLANQAPVHPNCPHEWRQVAPEQIPCEDMIL